MQATACTPDRVSEKVLPQLQFVDADPVFARSDYGMKAVLSSTSPDELRLPMSGSQQPHTGVRGGPVITGVLGFAKIR
jgi:hypothetical protein